MAYCQTVIPPSKVGYRYQIYDTSIELREMVTRSRRQYTDVVWPVQSIWHTRVILSIQLRVGLITSCWQASCWRWLGRTFVPRKLPSTDVTSTSTGDDVVLLSAGSATAEYVWWWLCESSLTADVCTWLSALSSTHTTTLSISHCRLTVYYSLQATDQA